MAAPVPGSIPWKLVREWTEFHGRPADDVDFLDYCLREMDSVYADWHAKQVKKATAGKPR